MSNPIDPGDRLALAGTGHDLVRPFIMTGGRTGADHGHRLEALVQRVPGPIPTNVPFEQRALLERSDAPISMAELAAELDLVVGVVAVLVGDLLHAGLIDVYESDPDDLELGMLTRMVEKIRSL